MSFLNDVVISLVSAFGGLFGRGVGGGGSWLQVRNAKMGNIPPNENEMGQGLVKPPNKILQLIDIPKYLT